MIPRDPDADDGPEPAPPAELLWLRNALRRPPAAEVRANHLVAVAAASRQRSVSGPMGRYASRSARVAAAVVASLVITTGLAAAQVLPPPAQRLLSNVSDRFAPSQEAPATTVGDLPSTPGVEDPEGGGDPGGDQGGDDVAPAVATPTTDAVADHSPPTTRSRPVIPSTTIPGPTDPGSPTDPTDPGPTDPTTTTTTVDPSTTTTTVDPGSTTTTTEPGPTTTTTEAPSP